MASVALTPASFESLPRALQLAVFALLPADQRMRCAEVRRSWHATLVDSSLWTRLDLSGASAVVARVTDALLRAASARAGGQLESLDVTDCEYITDEALLAVVTANAGALRELHVGDAALAMPNCEAILRAAPQLRVFGRAGFVLSAEQVEALFVIAPQLHTFYTRVGSADAHRMLRNEPPFGPLRARFLTYDADGGEADVLALAADMAGHTSLAGCRITGAQLDTPAVADALLGAVLTLQMTTLALCDCALPPAAVPALARVLGGGWLTERHVSGAEQMLDAPAAALLSNALRLTSTLTALTLFRTDLWRDPAAGTALLGALTGHPSLRQLMLNGNAAAAEQQAAAGRSLGTLVTATAALQELDIRYCNLGDAGLGPLVDALASNTHLHTLRCDGNNITVAFTRTRLLPAVITNTSLRELLLHDEYIGEEGEEDDLEGQEEERKEGVALLRKLEDAVAARFTAPAAN